MRTSFENTKIYWNSIEDQILEIEKIFGNRNIKQILAIYPTTPDRTTTAKCSNIYYEYFL